MRAEVARGLRSLREVNAGGRGFPLNRDYLYGSYFFLFLHERYGEHAVSALHRQLTARNIAPFKVDSNALASPARRWTRSGASTTTGFARASRRRRATGPGTRAPARLFAIRARAHAVGDALVCASRRLHPAAAHAADAGAAPRLSARPRRDTRLTAAPGRGARRRARDLRNHNLSTTWIASTQSGKREDITRCERDRFAARSTGGRIATVRVRKAAPKCCSSTRRRRPARSIARPGRKHSAASPPRATVSSLPGCSLAMGAPRYHRTARRACSLADAAVKHSPRFGELGGRDLLPRRLRQTYDVWSWRGGSAPSRAGRASRLACARPARPSTGKLLLTTLEADGAALRMHRLPATPLEERAVQYTQPARNGSEPLAFRRPAYSALADAAADLLGAAHSDRRWRRCAWRQPLGQDALELHQYVLGAPGRAYAGRAAGQAAYLYDGRHGLIANRTLTVRATEPGRLPPQIKAYSIKDDAQWVSLWRSLSLNRATLLGARRRARARGALPRLSLGNCALVQDERVVGLLAGIDSRRSSGSPKARARARNFASSPRPRAASAALSAATSIEPTGAATFRLARSVARAALERSLWPDRCRAFRARRQQVRRGTSYCRC